MNPIVCPMCLIYFLITTSTEKYNLLYVYTSEYESGGQVCTLSLAFMASIKFAVVRRAVWVAVGTRWRKRKPKTSFS
jgi:hypothetical protein